MRTAFAEPPAMIRAVHQFHSGSALGDAITNAMLLIRRILREQGFHSDIFVEHPDPRLGEDIYDLGALPRHPGVLLLVHHSMGYDAWPAIVALPASKILIYHNITPPELLTDEKTRRYALEGRRQLAAFQPHVAAALADSTYNALELHAAGFSNPQTCPLLFDTAELRRRAGRHLPPSPIFTVLFAGRFVSFKGQDALIAAFAIFRSRYAGRCRLVLPGGMNQGDAEYLDQVEQAVFAADLQDDIVLPGLIPDDELHGWFSRADLFVSLSQHEGFGVPLVEAMAHAVPVLAWPAGAVPYTLGGAAELLTDRSPEAVAERMLALAADPARRAAIVAAQDRVLGTFDLGRHVPVLLQAVARAGGGLPDPAASGAMAANMRFVVAGHVNKTYSLAAVNRAVARAIDAVRPGAVRLMPVEGEATSDLSEVPEDALAEVAALAAREPFSTGPVVVISQHYPVFVPKPEPSDVTLAMVFWEESLLPAQTVAQLEAGFDAVLAPSAFVAKALRDSGLRLPVLTVGHAPPLPGLSPPRAAGRPFSFLHVSSGFPRKGLDILLAAWADAFAAGGDVRLLVKTFPNPHNDAAAQIATLQSAHPALPPIELIDRDLDAGGMAGLYAETDCVVLPTRGEGYNLVAAEAMAAGLRLIVTGLGGHMDFCTDETARLLPFRFAPSGSHLATPFSLWAEPDHAALAQALRDAPASPAPGEAARRAILRHADPAAFVDRLAQAAASVIAAGPLPAARVAWVSSWEVRCGVAEYSRALLAALPRHGVAHLAIVCDDRTQPGEGVRPAGQLGDSGRGRAVLNAIMSEDAEIIVIQHQPGLLDWPALAWLLGRLAQQRRAVLVTLHNVRHLLDVPIAEREAVIAAFQRVARVLVHTVADLDQLQSWGLGGQSALFPHGAPWPFPASQPSAGPPVIGSYGFFLPGKGIGQLIEAAALLRRTRPGLRLRLVCADYGTAESAAEIARCRGLAHDLGLDVEWHTGFLPPEQSAALLRTCHLVVLPTLPSLESSSASLRSVLAAGAPVAVTPIALFDEAGPAVARLPGGSPAALAAGVAALLADPGGLLDLQSAGEAWLRQRQWPDLARRLHGMILGCAAQAHVDLHLNR